MNSTSAIDLLRSNVDDLYGDNYTDSVCQSLLQNAAEVVYNTISGAGIFYNRELSVITIAANTQETTVTFDIQRPIVAKDKNNISINIGREEHILESTDRAIYIYGRKIGWYVKPSELITFSLSYVPKFDATGNDYGFDIVPVEFHQCIVLYATVLALGRDKDKIQYWQGLYNNALEEAINNAGQSAHVNQVTDMYYGHN